MLYTRKEILNIYDSTYQLNETIDDNIKTWHNFIRYKK